MLVTIVKKSLKFIVIHVSFHILNFIVAYMNFYTCYNFSNNVFKSLVYSYLYNSSDYCIALSSMMNTLSSITQNMWSTVGVTVCIESVSFVRPYVKSK